MNEKELTYNTALDIVFMNRCHNCVAHPKMMSGQIEQKICA